ncbi:NifB/NifX family molybdenum-iron cluster-binding protein [Desulfobacula sp.]|uniref:NifB/NifX family molybdenum-iron cluster-binding protein n=1 Tax=Desulfobacula sp. TaxID=2593537 RepID=UPI0025BD6C82|nr:NifB/NifX family molybdenum-iron cluster-binding protein [Desulfobacula sp.]MBC2703319.1 NifB/NifX family molybdenum-iron cluster-binding protein [Desulfobacula sp.]
MKIGISSTGKDMNSQIDPRFGRCAYFMIIQTDDMSFEVLENEYKSMGGGAGIQAANFIHSKDVKAVLTGNCGPNAMNVFSECNIDVITGQAGLIKNAVGKFKKGKLKPSVTPTVNEKFGVADDTGQGNNGSQGQGRGMGGGRGIGRGRGIGGGGRGMGGGGGQGMGGGRGMGGGQGMGRGNR